jgi:amidohydrolase
VTLDTTLVDRLVALRRDLHRHPEVGWDVERTAGRVERELADLGIPSRRIAGTGVLADIPGTRPLPRVALRADMDALPLQEADGHPFASTVLGAMHACGHDGHVSALVGAAALLAADPSSAPVRFLFQPAEETGEGALRLIEERALDGVAYVFGLHLDIALAARAIAAPEGAVNASTDEFTILLVGPGGHAARPHETADPIVAAGFLIAELQTVVSRQVPPHEPAVVTVGRVSAGTASNVIAEEARLDGTVRAASPEVRELLRGAIRRVAEGAGITHRVAVTVQMDRGTPPVINRPEPTRLARLAATEVVGPDGVRVSPLRNMGGEDFGCYLEHVEGAFVRIGARIEDGVARRAHAGSFDFDERALGTAAAYLAAVARTAGRELERARA